MILEGFIVIALTTSELVVCPESDHYLGVVDLIGEVCAIHNLKGVEYVPVQYIPVQYTDPILKPYMTFNEN